MDLVADFKSWPLEYPKIELPCPFCGTWQVQILKNVNQPEHSKAKCRHCHAEARVSTWNARHEPKKFPL